MKKIISLLTVLFIITCMASSVYARQTDDIYDIDPETYRGSDYVDNEVIFAVKSEYSFSDDLVFDGEFFGIDEIISSNPALPLNMVLSLKEKHPDFKRSYTATLSEHNKDLVIEVIKKLSESDYVAYAQPNFYYYLAGENDFTEEQNEYIEKIASQDSSFSSFFSSNGKMNIESIADLGDDVLMFYLFKDVDFGGLDQTVYMDSFYYTESTTRQVYITVNDKIYLLCDAYNNNLVDGEMISKILSYKFSFFHITGDVNDDYTVDIFDVVNMRSNIIKQKPVYSESADLNHDYIVDIIDVVLLRNIIVNN